MVILYRNFFELQQKKLCDFRVLRSQYILIVQKISKIYFFYYNQIINFFKHYILKINNGIRYVDGFFAE